MREHYGKGNPKLNKYQVQEIRDAYRDTIISYVTLAERYKVNLRTIFDIVQRRTWKHLPERERGTYRAAQV